MNGRPPSDDSVTALIDYIQRESDQACAQILDEARDEAARALRLARSSANRAVRQAIDMDRRRLQRQVAEEAVRRRLRRREQEQADTRRTLRAMTPAVRKALLDLWRQPEFRRSWIAASLDLAGRRLAERNWVIGHPADLDPDEVASACDRPLALEPVAGQDAGLLIRAGGACIDTTPRGLTAREAWVQGLLLGCLDPAEGKPSDD